MFTRDGEERRVGGFYDGDGRYVIRALADAEGVWTFETHSTARSLDGLTGTVVVGPPVQDAHGPVRVDGFHFRHADGTRHRPLGTTAYAWTHQPEELQEQTLATLAEAPFTKMRMCVFPKSYLYNANELTDFPFPGSLDDGFDLERFDPAHFRRLERRIQQLAALGIEADLILFHAYDRWGFADLGPAVDERYLRYVVRRLSGFANVWWSMANEYDLLWAKDTADWERLAAVVGEEDASGHLNSIHNCRPFYDYSAPWITHVSVQRVDVYRTAENTDEWRERWGKPVVIDECAYEGDIDQGWGNITGEEMVRRFWRVPCAAAMSVTVRPTCRRRSGATTRRCGGPRAASCTAPHPSASGSSSGCSPKRPRACGIRCPATGTSRGAVPAPARCSWATSGSTDRGSATSSSARAAG